MPSRNGHLSCVGALLVLSLAAWAGPPPHVTPAPAAPPETLRLIQSALARMKEDPQLSLRLLLEARARGPSLESTSALREWLAQPGRAVLRGHTGAVVAMAFSPDGQWLATGSEDGTVRLWHGVSGQPRGVLRGHTGPVSAVAFRSDGAWLATGGIDGTVHLWEPGSGKELEVLRGHSSAVKTLLFRPAHSQLVSVGSDGTAYLWHAREGSQPVPLGHEGRVHSVAFDATGSRLITAGQDDYTREWNPDSGDFLSEWYSHGIRFRSVSFSPDGERVLGTEGKAQALLLSASAPRREQEGSLERLQHEAPVLSASFSPDGHRVLTLGEEGKATIWNLGHGPREEWSMPEVRSALFAPRGPYLLTLGEDGLVRLWGDTSYVPRLELREHEEVEEALFSPDATRLVTASRDGTVRLWAVPDLEPAPVKLPTGSVWESRLIGSHQVLFSPDGTLLLSLKDTFITPVQLWDATTGEELRTLDTRGRPILSVAFDDQGGRLATLGRPDGYLRLWDPRSGKPLRREPLPETPNLVTALRALPQEEFARAHDEEGSVTFSPDGRYLLTAFTRHDARLWTRQRGQYLTLKGAAGSPRPAFSPDSRRVVTGGAPHEVVLWDTATGRESHRLRHGPTSTLVALAFSPDGRWLATAGDTAPFVHVWDVESGRELATPGELLTRPTSLAFSPDGARLVITTESVYDNGLWDPLTGEQLASLVRPGARPMLSATFSPDGTLVLSVDDDRSVSLWSALRGTLVWKPRTPDSAVSSASFSPDGERILTVGKEDSVRGCALCAPFEELVERARPFLVRELTCDERREYLHEDSTCPPSEEQPER